jgi:DnaJ-class molecular chaperone
MTLFSDQLAEWTRAYGLLGVEHEATAHAIRDAYRRMVKRWHPDLYPAGSSQHAEATQMTVAINNAYKSIAQAPLRYQMDSQSRASMPIAATAYSVFLSTRADLERPHRPDRIEFWVRFVCGAIFGAFMGVGTFLTHWNSTSGGGTVLALISAVALVSALCSARFGDRYWHGVVRAYGHSRYL